MELRKRKGDTVSEGKVLYLQSVIRKGKIN